MLFNTPQVQIIDDQDHQAVVKITGYYNTGVNANNLVVQANTLFGANNSRACILSVNSWEYSSSLSNGFITLEWVSTANQNTTIFSVGRFNDGAIARYVPNNANTPTGDINLVTANAQPGDCFSIVLSLMKEFNGNKIANNYLGVVTTGANGAGAWANTQAGYNNQFGY